MSRPIKFSKRYCKVLGSVCADKYYSVYLFMYIIITYALENNAAFNTLLKNKNKLSAIHLSLIHIFIIVGTMELMT